MFLKIGDRVLNTDHIVQANLNATDDYDPARPPTVILLMRDGLIPMPASNRPTPTAMPCRHVFYGPEAEALRAFFSAEDLSDGTSSRGMGVGIFDLLWFAPRRVEAEGSPDPR